ncbi:MAG: CpsD/CapB family tyrosine-protein kinase [Acidiferrobacterales bacterium]|nr:CpsD/CapB family tyrosine-protein kinase [Acidiferrobacterales bacterium]
MVEKIKLALERAYKEREGNSQKTVSTTVSLSEPKVEPQSIGGTVTGSFTHSLTDSRYSVVDTDKLARNRIVTYDDTNEHAESFRLLRTQLLHYIETAGVSTIGITSPAGSDGKTIVSLNLAISMVRSSDINVVLVDGDLATPSVDKLLGLDVTFGLVDLLNNHVGLSEVLQRVSIPNLWIIPGRREAVNLMDKRHASRVEELVDGFSISDRSIVIVDLPPVLGRDDTLAFTTYLDGILLVVQEGETKTEEVERAMNLLKQCNVLGTVLNKSTQKQSTR